MDPFEQITQALRVIVSEEVARQVDQLALAPRSTGELPRYFDTAGAAAYASRSADTIRKACQSGELFAKQRVKGGNWMIRPESIDAWIDGTEDPHREQVEKWKRGPTIPPAQRPRRKRYQPPREDGPDGPEAA